MIPSEVIFSFLLIIKFSNSPAETVSPRVCSSVLDLPPCHNLSLQIIASSRGILSSHRAEGSLSRSQNYHKQQLLCSSSRARRAWSTVKLFRPLWSLCRVTGTFSLVKMQSRMERSASTSPRSLLSQGRWPKLKHQELWLQEE